MRVPYKQDIYNVDIPWSASPMEPVPERTPNIPTSLHRSRSPIPCVDCPGTQSERAGRTDACTGCPNQTVCATAPKGPDPDLPLIAANLFGIRRILLVLSGKGGVGKSTVTAQLARSLAAAGHQVGVLDVDICGPSQPQMLGVADATLHISQFGLSPVIISGDLEEEATGGDDAGAGGAHNASIDRGDIAVVSVGFLLRDKEDAVIWRGPKKNALVKQFLRDVQWTGEGPLDVLLVDTPPGTSDEHLALVQALRSPPEEGDASVEAGLASTAGGAPIVQALLVSTPQEVAWQDVRKEIDFCHKTRTPIVGLIENMAGFVCGHCKRSSDIFTADRRMHRYCQEHGIALLASIPMDPSIGMACDQGLALPTSSPIRLIYDELAHRIMQMEQGSTETAAV